MHISARKSAFFFLKILFAASVIFVLGILRYGIGTIDNRSFDARLRNSKDTLFVLTFFVSWQSQEQPLSAVATNNFGSINRPVKHLFIALDDPQKVFYSTIPYLITHDIRRDAYFIGERCSADHGFLLTSAKKLPGSWFVCRTANGAVKYVKIADGLNLKKVVGDK